MERIESTQDLLKLYDLALQEYRFQVNLNWDRLKHAFVVDGVLIGAALGIWKLGAGATPPAIVGWILALAFGNSVVGILGSRTGHSYYLETRRVKANVEKKLGLDESGMALSSTAGMREEHRPEVAPLTLVERVGRRVIRVNTYLELVLAAVAIFSAWQAIVILHRE